MKFFQGLIILALAAFVWACGHYIMPQDWGHHTVEPGTLALQGTDIKGYQQFVFADSMSTPILSDKPILSDNNNKFLDKVANYMGEHPTHKVIITGKYLPEEKTTGSQENMGLERADNVRMLLVNRNVDIKRTKIGHKEVQLGGMSEPVSFKVEKPPVEKKESGKQKYAEISRTPDNMTYSDAIFETNSAVLNTVSEGYSAFKKHADKVKITLDKDAKKKLLIIGHTDSDGSPEYNMDLGMRRAESVRQYFKNLDVKNAISIESKGETDPAGANDSAENKLKNRRVNIVIK